MPRLKSTTGATPLPKPVNFGDEPIFIGRAKKCEIVLHDKLASRKHAKAYKEQGFYFIEDLDSQNGTFVNNKEIKGSKKLSPNDVIKIGSHEIVFDDYQVNIPLPTKKPEGFEKIIIPKQDATSNVAFGALGTIYNLTITNQGKTFYKALIKPITTVGRGEEADITIDEHLASRLHCHFEIKAGGLKLVDLESRNGTKVNGNFVNQKYIEPTDNIQIGETFVNVNSREPLSTEEFQVIKKDELQKKVISSSIFPDTKQDVIQENISEYKTDEEAIIPYLVYNLEDGSVKTFILHRDEVTIGRSNDAVLTIQDKLASRIHVRIFKEDKRFFIEDLDSRNGTKINDREVKGKIELIPGDRIQIGEYEFIFLIPESSQPQNNKGLNAKPAGKNLAVSLPLSAQIPKKSRKKIIRNTTNVAAPVISALVLIIVAIVVVLFFNNIRDNDSGIKTIGDEPKPVINPMFNPTSRTDDRTTQNTTNKRTTDDKKDPFKNSEGPFIDPKLDPDPDVNFINAGKTDFERNARKVYVKLRNQTWDNIDMKMFGKAYTGTMDYIKEYQNIVSDEVFDEIDKLLKEIREKAAKFWEDDLEPRIKATPETERNKFFPEIQRAFEGYETFYEPAIQMISH